eukprot:gene38765-3227_t
MGSCASGGAQQRRAAQKSEGLTNAAFVGIPGVAEQYSVLRVLGKGAFGTVYQCKRRRPPEAGAQRAVKVLRKLVDGNVHDVVCIQ